MKRIAVGFVLFLSVNSYGQIVGDSLAAQMRSDLEQLEKQRLKVDSLKRFLDSIKFESQKTHQLIDSLRVENKQLELLMNYYQEQINRRQQEKIKKEDE